ncbi:hypothetical protein [uncultured Aquimonas sp.]|uniref:hypothetical protein n=1 Tax=uncultured Aquimonas sp. TaxID=385483 RepID=UPI00086A6991|nr:hypothetical protein [uncultured Aquimonas sp.]ODS51163.1 MAG: hypothetical protein ABS37_23170 [Acidovorax sp. SCN 65-108]
MPPAQPTLAWHLALLLGLGIEVVQQATHAVDEQHRLRLCKEIYIRMGNAALIAQRVQGVNDVCKGSEDLVDLCLVR